MVPLWTWGRGRGTTGHSRRLIVVGGLVELPPAHFRRWTVQAGLVERAPHLGKGVAAPPRLRYGLEPPAAAPVRLLVCLVGVKEGTPKGSDGVDLAAVLVRQERACPVGTPRRDHRGDAEGPALVQDHGAG